MRRTAPVCLALALALLALASRAQEKDSAAPQAVSPAAVPAAVPARPNILFITSDDHRWDALGAAGNLGRADQYIARRAALEAKEGVRSRPTVGPRLRISFSRLNEMRANSETSQRFD